MLRCENCRAYAHAGLGHIHGTGMTLCRACTEAVLAQHRISVATATATVEATGLFLRGVLVEKPDEAIAPVKGYEHTEFVPLTA